MHVIRLHGPWTAEIAKAGRVESRRVHLPREWAIVGELAAETPVRLLRRFHRPTGLGESTQVRLAVPAGWPVGEVTVNGGQVAELEISDGHRRFNLSSVVRSREAHDLVIEFRSGRELKEEPYLVALEIEEPG